MITIAMRKDDETAFVNARTYWELSMPCADETLELRVRHQHPEDVFTCWSINRGERDDVRLHTAHDFEECVDAYQEHEQENRARPGHGSHERRRNARCDALNTRGHVVMNPIQTLAFKMLRRHWDAFVLLFNPAINM